MNSTRFVRGARNARLVRPRLPTCNAVRWMRLVTGLRLVTPVQPMASQVRLVMPVSGVRSVTRVLCRLRNQRLVRPAAALMSSTSLSQTSSRAIRGICSAKARLVRLQLPACSSSRLVRLCSALKSSMPRSCERLRKASCGCAASTEMSSTGFSSRLNTRNGASVARKSRLVRLQAVRWSWPRFGNKASGA